MQTKESVERQYELLKELYGIQSSGCYMNDLTDMCSVKLIVNHLLLNT